MFSYDAVRSVVSRAAWRASQSLFAAAVGLAVAAGTAAAQTKTAQIAGIVRDSSGGVLPGAIVTARQPSTGTVLERTTDAQGRFVLPELRVGQWDLTVTLSGFAPQTRRGIAIDIGRTVNLEFMLDVGGL